MVIMELEAEFRAECLSIDIAHMGEQHRGSLQRENCRLRRD